MQSNEDDNVLLGQYITKQSDAAFTALVARHVNLVYSVALRRTANTHHAEEITQAVFIILARKAGQLRHAEALSSWLFQTTRLTASNFVKSEASRHRREEEAFMQSTLDESETEAWRQIAPLLDEAVSGLREKDRRAILMRFYEGRSLRDVGSALGASEDAAVKRVNRALERLRKFFGKHGVKSTTAIIAGVMAAHSVQAAPAALAKSVAMAASVKGAAVSGSTLTLIKGVLKIMAWTKAKTAVVASVGILLLAGTTTVTVKQIEGHRTYAWQVPMANFDVFYKMPPEIKIVPTKFTADGGACSDSTRGAMGIAQTLETIVEGAYQKDKLRTVFLTNLPTNRYDFIAKTDTDKWPIELQQKIAEQFGIVGHLEMRDTDVMILRPSEDGVRGFNTSQSRKATGPRTIRAITEKPGDVSYFDQPLITMIRSIEQELKIPVIDKTGLTGHYDFGIKWDEPDRKQPNPDGLKQALRDQLGLELVPGREPLEILVVAKK